MGGDLVNKERILGVLLFLLSLGLAVGPIVAAFSANGWDLKATLLGGSNPLETQFGNLQNLNTENMFGNPALTGFSAQGVTATIPITSPLDFPIKIKSFSANLTCRDHSVVLSAIQLGSEVEIPARGTTNVSVTGTIPQAAVITAELTAHGGIPPNIGIENVSIKLDIYGIILEGAIGSV